MDKRYEVIKIIGRGSFSTVFLGKHKIKNEKVAIKTESKKSSTEGNSLKHECRILLHLAKIPGIPTVRYFEFGESTTPNVFMVIDYYEKSIDSVVKILNVHEKFHVFKEAFKILKSIHSKYIVHRDIKPANFMINHEGDVYLIDFGMAKVDIASSTPAPEKKQITEIIGTPRFVSLFIHELMEPSQRDDFISLGYTFLYMVLDGNLPWDNTNLEDIRNKKIEFLKNTELFIENYLSPAQLQYQEYVFYIAEFLKTMYLSKTGDLYELPLPPSTS